MAAEPCECEHEAHTEPGKHTPNGNPGHLYGTKFLRLVEVKTTWGTYKVCPDCERDCHHPDQGFRKEP